MAVDPALEEALQVAVDELNQPRSVAQRLTAWLRALSEGDASEDRNLQFYESVLAAIRIEGSEDEN